jgi:hypothetical protein
MNTVKSLLTGSSSLQARALSVYLRDRPILDVVRLIRENQSFRDVMDTDWGTRIFLEHLLYERTPREIADYYGWDGAMRNFLIEKFSWKQAFERHFSGLSLSLDCGIHGVASSTDYLNAFVRLGRASWFKLKYNRETKTPLAVEKVGDCRPNTQPPMRITGEAWKEYEVADELEIVVPNNFRNQHNGGIKYDKVTDHVLLCYHEQRAGPFTLNVLYCASLSIVVDHVYNIVPAAYRTPFDRHNPPQWSYADGTKISYENFREEFARRKLVKLVDGADNVRYYHIVKLY